MLAHFSPEYPCLAQGLANLEPRIEDTFGGKQPGLHITLEFVNSRGKYVPGDEPRLRHRLGRAAALLRPAQPGRAVPRRATSRTAPRGRVPRGRCTALTGPPTTAAASARHAETKLISALLSGSYGDDPANVPALATLLAGPLLRGSEVGSVRHRSPEGGASGRERSREEVVT